MDKNRILVVDDEREIVELLSLYLEKDGYEVLEAYDGLEALNILLNEKVDMAVIDIMMPNMDGYTLLKRIRQEWNIPVLMLSAKSDFSDKILGLDLGADDYVAKPFNALEVLARINAQLRRYHKLNNEETVNEDIKKLVIGKLEIDNVNCSVFFNNNPITLTSTEYKLLFMLAKNPGKVFTKKQIFEHVWNEPFYGDDNTIMVHISNLRDKIEPDSKSPKYIKTVRGLGYKLEKL